MSDAAHESRAHATLGASSSHRWMACPASIRLSAGMPNKSSRFADEGTAAHQLAERCLRLPFSDPQWEAPHFIGKTETVRNTAWEVTEEMAEAVQVFVSTVTGAVQPGDTLLVEQRFDLSSIHPRMFGTNDACVVSPSRRTLYVFDYKHGKGHAVEAVGNPQLRYYGLGALLNSAGGGGIDRLVLTIVQPRAPHRDGPIRSETISVMDLLEWTQELKAAAVRTEAPDAPVVAGEHCLFCPAAGVCPALRDKALEGAMVDFASASITVPADPGVLSVSEMAAILDKADLIDNWVSAVRAHALHLAEAGTEVPGYKLVDKRATRKWREDEHQTVGHLGNIGLTDDDLFKRTLLSPAQIEKLLPKDKRHLLADLVEKVSSGRNLVPDTDARTAQAPSAIADFANLF